MATVIGVFAVLLAFYVAKRQPAVMAAQQARDAEAATEAQPS